MEAIEFKTIIHNGTVVIPPEYSSQWEGKAIRVIVLNDSELLSEPVQKLKQVTFNAISLNTQGFDFNREEANVR
ncbi:MAG: hypothetical protein V7L11_24610 [Nostoc sp.]|uniref:hypothetical protein n=1 Tax=Nostoc sp. TaxID=1180 RepID=UPI002FFCBD17